MARYSTLTLLSQVLALDREALFYVSAARLCLPVAVSAYVCLEQVVRLRDALLYNACEYASQRVLRNPAEAYSVFAARVFKGHGSIACGAPWHS